MGTATILVVDDERKLRDLVRSYLEAEGYVVLLADTGLRALEAVERAHPDLIVLDLMLPDLSGEEVARSVRTHSDVPIIMLTAKAGEDDRVAGLRLGADECLVKLFSPRELVARIEAVLRRAVGGGAAGPLTFDEGRLQIDPEAHEVRVDGSVVELTRSEFDLLVALATRPGRVYSRYELVARVQGYDYEGYERTIDAHVKNLRRKLGDDPRNPRYLVTVILVNLAFGDRFTDYLQDQRHVRQEQIVAALAESYERMGGWDPVDLEGLESLALMDGGTVRLEDVSAATVWEPAATGAGARMAEMHRRMMGGGPLGPEQRLQIVVADEVVGTAIVRFPEPGALPQDRSFRASVNRLLLLGGVVAGVLALALGIVLARKATAPARELTQTARALSARDRSQRVSHEAPDELGEMARAFNQMADTIEEEDRLRRALAADVAQELRPPLTILRSQIEAMQDGVVSADGEALASLHE